MRRYSATELSPPRLSGADQVNRTRTLTTTLTATDPSSGVATGKLLAGERGVDRVGDHAPKPDRHSVPKLAHLLTPRAGETPVIGERHQDRKSVV